MMKAINGESLEAAVEWPAKLPARIEVVFRLADMPGIFTSNDQFAAVWCRSVKATEVGHRF
jgi:hypothetical protein